MGKTELLDQKRVRWQKHPHIQGEDALKPPAESKAIETPPHTWGRLY